MKSAELTGEEQTAILAERYSHRAEAYDELWSPIIRLRHQVRQKYRDVAADPGGITPAGFERMALSSGAWV